MADQNIKANPWGEEEKKPKKWTTKRVLLYLGLFALFLLISYFVAQGQGLRPGIPMKTNARHLSDGFFVVGLFVTGVGLLTMVSSTGFFDIFSYAFKSFLVLFTPFVKPENFPKFYDYKMDKSKKRKKPEMTLLLMGIALLILSALALWVYRA